VNPLYQSMIKSQPSFNANKFWDTLNRLKKSYSGDPNQKIQELLNSGKVTQAQYNQAVQRAQEIQRLLGR